MAFSEWIQNSNGNILGIHGSLGSVNGSRELLIDASGGATGKGSCTAHLDPTTPHSVGYTAGRIRTLAHRVYTDTSNRNNTGPVIFFGTEAIDVTTGFVDYWTFGINIRSETQGDWILAHATNVNMENIVWDIGSGGDIIAEGTTDTAPIAGSVWPMQVEWEYSIAKYGGMRIRCSIGNKGDLNYANLAEIYDVVDFIPHPGAPTFLSEGVGFMKNDANPTFISGQDIFLFDDTEIGTLT